MVGNPVVVFCENCGTGINLVKGDPVFKCKKCGTSPICEKCYDRNLKICINCAEPIIRKKTAEIEKERNLKQQKIDEERNIRDKKTKESVDTGKCIICNRATKNGGLVYRDGSQGGTKWPGNIIFKTGFECDSCRALICIDCWDKTVVTRWENIHSRTVMVGNYNCPFCNRSYHFEK